MKLKYLTLALVTILLSSCAIITDEYQVNQRKVIAYLLEDLPLPSDADIIKVPSVLLGTGDAISGRIVLTSGYSPAENLIFYGNETPSTGWSLLSSKVGEEVLLVYTKNDRIATIDMKPAGGFVPFLAGDQASDIVISVIHPDSIAEQKPYEDLNYNNLPEVP
ncbi:hypothetical protein M9C81_06650 [SAR86 cluster bacterium]|nr:hypothetical protein M9C81_06650 [SAR86 cluster bacterium]